MKKRKIEKDKTQFLSFSEYAKQLHNIENMSDIIIECLSNLGNIIDINNESQGSIEVWVKDSDGEAHIGYLFPYDQGVIECRFS